MLEFPESCETGCWRWCLGESLEDLLSTKKIKRTTFCVEGPEIRIIAIAERPGGVERA